MQPSRTRSPAPAARGCAAHALSAKQLVPVANKPVLFYGIAGRPAPTWGIEDITDLVSPAAGSEIRERAGDGSRWGLRIGYVVQEQALGLAHAVLTGEEAIG